MIFFLINASHMHTVISSNALAQTWHNITLMKVVQTRYIERRLWNNRFHDANYINCFSSQKIEHLPVVAWIVGFRVVS